MLFNAEYHNKNPIVEQNRTVLVNIDPKSMQQDYLVGFTINLYNLRAPTMGNGLSVSSEGTHRNSIWFGPIQHRGLTLARRMCWFGFWF